MLRKRQTARLHLKDQKEWSAYLQIRGAAEPHKVLPQLEEERKQTRIGLSASPSALSRQRLPISQALQQACHAACYGTYLAGCFICCRAAGVTPPRP